MEPFVLDKGVDLGINFPFDNSPSIVKILLSFSYLMVDIFLETTFFELFDSEYYQKYP